MDEDKITGWDSITNEAERVYPGQKNPLHYGTLIRWIFGGDDPLDGVSIYDGGDYWHFVTYGLSELYEKETDNMEYSGYGMEFTLKLRKGDYDEENELKNIVGLLQTISRITFTRGDLFLPFEYIYTGQKNGIDSLKKSNITGFITIPDTQFNTISTPNGKVQFVEFIGCTDNELTALKNKEIRVEELYKKLGNDLTDYNRESVI